MDPVILEDLRETHRTSVYMVMTFCKGHIETPGTVTDFFGECSPKVARFRDELLWLTEHWSELDGITVP